MGLYRLLFRGVFLRMDPERAHDFALRLIAVAGRAPLLAGLLRATLGRQAPAAVGASDKLGRRVSGHLGLAAGMDKDGTAIHGMAALGFSHVEIGTVTALPQHGNSRPRLWRIPEEQALRNRMGFNNSGARAAGEQLRRLRMTRRGRSLIVGANIGKSRAVDVTEAVADYVTSTRHVARWCDYLVVNVSSPNTPGLRDLQAVSSLRPILVAVQQAADEAAQRRLPVLVKVAPDLADADIDAVADLVGELGLAGVVATNTTIQHEHGPGGLSGQPLFPRSLTVVARLRERLGPDPLLIAVGGISSDDQAQAMLRAGADLLQALTAFVYQGPSWPGRLNRRLSRLAPHS
ncbi:MAG TPA: quinone-dependent dihydroorotate dehydrogenase [Actinomycetaceae bacterium]|nr:quinone-dependent dihydroorotate dehydrogenase [Actinomycetaceae bacterium]